MLADVQTARDINLTVTIISHNDTECRGSDTVTAGAAEQLVRTAVADQRGLSCLTAH